MKYSTLITKAGLSTEKKFGAINPPIEQMSTILFPTISDYENAKNGYSTCDIYQERDCSYGTIGGSTAAALSAALSSLETENNTSQKNRCNTLLYPSGLMALSMVAVTFAKAGGHVLVSDNAYSPFKNFLIEGLTKFGVDLTFYNATDKLDNLIRHNTSLIMIESPGSITCELTDIAEVVKLAQAHNIITAMDNSLSTPIFFKPLDHGIDVSLYAATKYINGYSDVLMGAVHARGETFKSLYNTYQNYGVSINSQGCYLVLRGLRTLELRVKQHQSIALKVAQHLENVPEVQHVLYPALPSFPQHNLWKKYFSGATSLFSIILDKKYSKQQLGEMIDKMDIFGIGASWGGYKSLILPFYLDQHNRQFNKYDNSCIRIFCGLEDPDDLIEDLEKSFERLRKA